MAAFLRLAFLAPGLAFAFASAPAEVVPELRAEAAALIRRFQEAKALEAPRLEKAIGPRECLPFL